jgi:hypothetical protein
MFAESELSIQSRYLSVNNIEYRRFHINDSNNVVTTIYPH